MESNKFLQILDECINNIELAKKELEQCQNDINKFFEENKEDINNEKMA